MKKFFIKFFVIAAFIGLLISCPETGGSKPGNNPKPNNPVQKATIVFDNTYGVCTVLVYDDYRRREMDLVAEVPAGRHSADIGREPVSSIPFYFAYCINLKGVNDFTMNYVPGVGKDQKAVCINANTRTVIPIPPLDETLSSDGQLLSSKSYLTLFNNSSYSFQLHRGVSVIRPDETPGSPVVNSGEKPLYTVSPGRAADYRLLVGADYESLPNTPRNFEAGYYYGYIYSGSVLLNSEIPIIIDNIVLKTYTVVFNTNGASGPVPASQVLEAGSVITLPDGNSLAVPGFYFAGWSTTPSGTEINYSANAVYTVTGDADMYAIWNPVGTPSFTVTFNSNGGNNVGTQSVLSGRKAIRPENPIRNGYTFAGWYGDQGLSALYDFSSSVTRNVNLYAKWDIIRFTVTFHANEGNGNAPSEITANYNSGITLPANHGLTKTGHTFGGWNTDASGTGINYSASSNYMVIGDVTLFAQWNPVPYTVSFNSNMGTLVPSQTVNYGHKVTRPAEPIRDGFSFEGWFKEQTCVNLWDFVNDNVTADRILYAKFSEGVILRFNKLYESTLEEGISHNIRFYVEKGIEYTFTSSVSVPLMYDDLNDLWFNSTNGTEVITATESGWVSIKIDTGSYSISVRNPEIALNEFAINYSIGVINEKNKTITVNLPFNTNIEELTPEFITAAGWECITGGTIDLSKPAEYAFAKGNAVQIYTVIIELTGQGEIIINPPVVSDIVIEGFPTEPFTISKNNLQGYSATILIQADSGYTGYEWYVDGARKNANAGSGERRITINAVDYSLGKHTFTLIVWKDGKPFSNETSFTVVE